MDRNPLANITNSVTGKRKRANDSGSGDGKENTPTSQLETRAVLDDGMAHCSVIGEGSDESLPELAIDESVTASDISFDTSELRKQIITAVPIKYRHQFETFVAQLRTVDPPDDSIREEVRQLSISSNKADLHTSAAARQPCRLEEEFSNFTRNEIGLSQRPSGHLVRPSGSLQSPLGIKLHYPTFSGDHLQSGEVGNKSFSCIRVLMSKGLSDQNAFWYECFFRREIPLKQLPGSGRVPPPTDSYSPALRKCHLEFAEWCEAQGPPVILLFGEAVQKMTAQSYPGWKRINVLEPPIGILLLENAGRIMKIGIIVPHPQHYLIVLTGRGHDGLTVARNMDRAINAAVALRYNGTDHGAVDPTYFERLLVAKRPSDSFNTNPRLAMIEGLQVQANNGIHIAYDEMHQSIREWLVKEKSNEDVKALVNAEVNSLGVSPLQIVQQWMTKKGNLQRDANLDQKRIKSGVDFEKTVERRTEPLEIKCAKCGKIGIDEMPMFGTEGPVAQKYIARTTKACANGCCKFKKDGKTPGKTPRAIDLIPTDPGVAYISQLAFRKLVQEAKK